MVNIFEKLIFKMLFVRILFFRSYASKFWLDEDVVSLLWMVKWMGVGDVTYFVFSIFIRIDWMLRKR